MQIICMKINEYNIILNVLQYNGLDNLEFVKSLFYTLSVY